MGEQLGSFDKAHILKISNWDDRISKSSKLTEKELKSIHVECVLLQDLIDKYHFHHVDLIHIDAEGHDEMIIASIDFKKIQPKMIIFEHMHMSFDGYCRCITHLEFQGYAVVYRSGNDTVVVRNDWVTKLSQT